MLLLGDVEQLPSVGPGNVFRELLECGRIPTTVLDVIYRQADTSRIVVNAAAIRQGSTKLQYGDDFVFEAAQILEKLPKRWNAFISRRFENGVSKTSRFFPPSAHAGPAP